MARPSRRRRVVAGVLLAAVVAGLLAWRVVATHTTHYRTQDAVVQSRTPTGTVAIDTRLYLPDGVSSASPAPAILLAHGFGGSKRSVAPEAADLADRGYVVLTWSARGFGRSTGRIGIDARDGEVADARNLVGLLARRDDVVHDAPGDPRVGVTGASYGGALALMLAGTDHRVDAVVPEITWNRLSRVFFPDGAGRPRAGGPAAPAAGAGGGVFKREWAGIFFGVGRSPGASASGASGLLPTPGSAAGPAATRERPGAGADTAGDLECGRFTAGVCRVYTRAAESGRLDASGRRLLDASSPWSVAGEVTAPTLLVQGEADTLFPLSEADVTADQVRGNGTPVAVRWTAGGHDAGGVATGDGATARLRDDVAAWFDHYLRGAGPAPGTDFGFDLETGLATTSARPPSGAETRTQTAPAYPLGAAVGSRVVALHGSEQAVVRPAGGVPASLTGLPGIGALASALAFDPPGQAASFASEPLARPVDVVGSPTVRVRVSGAPAGTVLFAKVYDAPPDGRPQLPQSQVVPVRVPAGAGTRDVPVVLPALAHRFEAGHRLVVTLATTDRAYATPTTEQVVRIGLAGRGVTVPAVPARAAGSDTSAWVWLTAGLLAALALGLLALVVARRVGPRRTAAGTDPALADTPVLVEGVGKEYDDGFVAVRSADLTLEREQVLGLLGPNGAGKTTTLRMLMGLIRPSRGSIRVFGHPVTPGAPVLSRMGCFVEGVGFLPHLSGRANLTLFWASTGRPEADAGLDEVLRIAGLGDAIDRPVRTYSQGMRQRLAIAQAMLGTPELLVLDEPTNGLDPPQIAEMREVLRRYAVDGRSVLVSSHQLAEVEQTCTHVAVMDRGLVVASGTVEEVSAAVPEDARHRLETAFLALIGGEGDA